MRLDPRDAESRRTFWERGRPTRLLLLRVLTWLATLASIPVLWSRGAPWWVVLGAFVLLGWLGSIVGAWRAVRHVVSSDKPANVSSVYAEVPAPQFGLAMSGGGIRSAAFNIGVLHALHQRQALSSIDVMSSVSGGSYAMSWYLLQLYYARQAQGAEFSVRRTSDAMFDPTGRFQQHLARHARISSPTDVFGVLLAGTLLQVSRGVVLDMVNRTLSHSVTRNSRAGGEESIRQGT